MADKPSALCHSQPKFMCLENPKMRLVVWNCCDRLTRDKWERLAALEPDVAVVPEARSKLGWFRSGEVEASGFLWQGLADQRGTAVFSFGDWSVRPAEEPGRLPWVMPVEVRGPRSLLLLAIWTVARAGSPSYEAQVAQAIDAYREEIETRDVVLAGDLNCSAQTANPKGHLRNVASLRNLGMESAYHAFHGIEQGDEKVGTLYWRWSRDLPFHCDQIIVPATWRGAISEATVGTFDDWVGARISDHVPVVVEVGLDV